ncbi:carbohydrate ABC transporter permease [Carnobacterium sp.]|uniref:carbohydrate ABC transporter permease n=1 Tax=Carnobacterium sp. TaxID=48221 RepID=UPI0028AFC219|nr:carbohydrate ABC transporter permease [Carnobacterium sp.]
MKKNKKVKYQAKQLNSFSKPVEILFAVLLGLFVISCIFPFIFVIILSLSSELSLTQNGYSLIPEAWSLEGFRYLFQMKEQLLHSIGISLFVTVVGTLLTIFMTSTYAYALSRSNFKYRKFFTFIILFTMLFSGGLVPGYIVMTQLLHLKDTIWALILPMCLSPFYVIVMRTFFKRSVPDSIIESAKIDGASEIRVFLSIVLPLALPGLATIGLFSTLGYWNDWFNALLYIDSANLVPLQFLLMKIQNTMEFISTNAEMSATMASTVNTSLPQESTRMAMVVISVLPIAMTYPFFQRYFVEGLTIGGVKE